MDEQDMTEREPPPDDPEYEDIQPMFIYGISCPYCVIKPICSFTNGSVKLSVVCDTCQNAVDNL